MSSSNLDLAQLLEPYSMHANCDRDDMMHDFRDGHDGRSVYCVAISLSFVTCYA